jgi:hypothetical protein
MSASGVAFGGFESRIEHAIACWERRLGVHVARPQLRSLSRTAPSLEQKTGRMRFLLGFRKARHCVWLPSHRLLEWIGMRTESNDQRRIGWIRSVST